MENNPSSNKLDNKLREHTNYSFVVHAEIVLPDGEKHFVLTDPFGTKHLLPHKLYKHYGFEKGQKINVRIDKISCSGKIYLEPSHPYYVEDQYYDFIFLKSLHRENIFGETELVWLLADISNNEIAMPMRDDADEPGRGEAVRCKISKIRKACLYLTHPQSKTAKGSLAVGSWQYFGLEKGEALIDDIPYYILTDQAGKHHLLKKKPFAKYEIKPGKQVYCLVVRWSNKGHYILEPEHPLYHIDQVYSFDVTLAEDDKIVVLDVFGNKIEIQASQIKEAVNSNRILLKISEIVKGIPVLRLP